MKHSRREIIPSPPFRISTKVRNTKELYYEIYLNYNHRLYCQAGNPIAISKKTIHHDYCESHPVPEDVGWTSREQYDVVTFSLVDKPLTGTDARLKNKKIISKQQYLDLYRCAEKKTTIRENESYHSAADDGGNTMMAEYNADYYDYP